MKLYLADTVQRERLGYNEKLSILNCLESYWAVRQNHCWTLFKKICMRKGGNNENRD